MSIKPKLLLPVLAAILSIGALSAANADDVMCSDFGGIIPEGDHNYDIIVDCDCLVDRNANVYGNVIEPGDTGWSITVDPEGYVSGNIEEKGDGYVYLTVGHGRLHTGNIVEEGNGYVLVLVDGVFDGSVEEQGNGDLVIHVFGPFPAGGPGYYTGKAEERDGGDAALAIDAGAIGYNGDLEEKGGGTCLLDIFPPDFQPPIGKIECD